MIHRYVSNPDGEETQRKLNVLRKAKKVSNTKKEITGQRFKKEDLKPQEQKDGYSALSGKLPLSLSIGTECGLVERIAEIGTALPIKGIKVFSTGSKVPDAVGIRLYAGEYAFENKNILLAELTVEDIKKMPNGRPLITVVFEVDAKGNIKIEAIDEGSLNSDAATVSSERWPSEQRVLDMVRRALNGFDEESERIGKIKLYQMIKEGLCSAEAKYEAVRKKITPEKRQSYKHSLRDLKAKIIKMKAAELTEYVGQSLMATINELNTALSADISNLQGK